MLCMLLSKLSVQLSSHIMIACRATSLVLPLYSAGANQSERNEAIRKYAERSPPRFLVSRSSSCEAVRDKLHISQLRVTLLDVDIERSRENHQIIVFLSCNGTTIVISGQ